jgi:hypothetical protein
MRALRITPRGFALLALCVFLLGALLSALAPAVRGAGGADWVEVCSVAGSKWVNAGSADAGTGSHQPPHGSNSGHCPWCSLQSAALLATGATQAASAAAHASPKLPRFDALPAHQVRAWALAPSRAPPLAS